MSDYWDDILVLKDPDTKEVVVSFTNDPTYGSVTSDTIKKPEPADPTQPPPPTGDLPVDATEPTAPEGVVCPDLPECLPHSCSSIEDYVQGGGDLTKVARVWKPTTYTSELGGSSANKYMWSPQGEGVESIFFQTLNQAEIGETPDTSGRPISATWPTTPIASLLCFDVLKHTPSVVSDGSLPDGFTKSSKSNATLYYNQTYTSDYWLLLKPDGSNITIDIMSAYMSTWIGTNGGAPAEPTSEIIPMGGIVVIAPNGQVTCTFASDDVVSATTSAPTFGWYHIQGKYRRTQEPYSGSCGVSPDNNTWATSQRSVSITTPAGETFEMLSKLSGQCQILGFTAQEIGGPVTDELVTNANYRSSMAYNTPAQTLAIAKGAPPAARHAVARAFVDYQPPSYCSRI